MMRKEGRDILEKCLDFLVIIISLIFGKDEEDFIGKDGFYCGVLRKF